MREIVLFLASLAGAAVMTALAVLVPAASNIWKYTLWGGTAIFSACACVLLIDLFRPGGDKRLLIGMGIGFALLIGFAIAFFLNLSTKPEAAQSQIQETPKQKPNITLLFIHPEAPALVIANTSDAVAYQIKWTAFIFNLDNPGPFINPNPKPYPNVHDILPIPISGVDYVRPHSSTYPISFFLAPLVSPHIKKGDRLFGSVSVICPECLRGRTFFVCIEWGNGGWFVELADRREGEFLNPKTLTTDGVKNYFDNMQKKFPENSRISIKDSYPFPPNTP